MFREWRKEEYLREWWRGWCLVSDRWVNPGKDGWILWRRIVTSFCNVKTGNKKLWIEKIGGLGSRRLRPAMGCNAIGRRRLSSVHSKTYHRLHFTVGGRWIKSLHLEPLQRCYCENLGSPTSACVMQVITLITYMQLLHTINGSLAVGRVGNILCGCPSYVGDKRPLLHSHTKPLTLSLPV